MLSKNNLSPGLNLSITDFISPEFEEKDGKLSKINVHMDSFMKWSDDFILSYDDIYYHIKDLSLNIISDSRFAPILNVSFNFAFRVDNPGKIWVIDSISSGGYNHYKSTLRDKKIDNLLN